MEEFIAWAIDTQSTEGHGLLGRYFFDNPIPFTPFPRRMQDCFIQDT